MKNQYWLRTTVLASFILFSFISKAQQSPAMDSLLSKAFSTDELLPLLIDSAMKTSPEMRVANSTVDMAGSSLQMNKKAIYNSFNLSSSYGYGTMIAASNNSNVGGGASNFSTMQRANYNLGVGVVLPLTQLLNRKNMIRSGKQQVNIAEAEKDNTQRSVKQEVIKMYQALKLSHRLLLVSSKSMRTAQINYTMAEKSFLQAQISIDQFSVTSENYNNAVQSYEANANTFQTNYLLLEAYTGVNIGKLLISQVK